MRVLEDGMKYSIMTVSRTGEGEQWSCCCCCCCFITCNCLNPDIRPDGGRQGAFKHKFLVMLLSVSQIILNTVRTADPLSTKTRVEVAGRLFIGRCPIDCSVLGNFSTLWQVSIVGKRIPDTGLPLLSLYSRCWDPCVLYNITCSTADCCSVRGSICRVWTVCELFGCLYLARNDG